MAEINALIFDLIYRSIITQIHTLIHMFLKNFKQFYHFNHFWWDGNIRNAYCYSLKMLVFIILVSFGNCIFMVYYTCSQQRERDHFNGTENQVKHDELINICFKIEINEHLTLADFWNANTTSVLCACARN